MDAVPFAAHSSRERATEVASTVSCRVVFGHREASAKTIDGRPVLHVALPILRGAGEEYLFSTVAEPKWTDGCALFRKDSRIGGFLVATSGLELEAGTMEVYRRLFAVTRGHHLYRIWNYVPRINAIDLAMENYQRFCRGRSLAFEEYFGAEFRRQLSAASAVGATAGPLAVGFIAGEATPRHFENPLQVPAFEYPSVYGPRSPSFARATAVNDAEGRQIFISGTASIRGHVTVAPWNLTEQLAYTIENLRLIATAAGAGPKLGAKGKWRRLFKVYLRHATDLAPVAAQLEHDLFGSDDQVQFLQADICRANLLLEIEATLTAAS